MAGYRSILLRSVRLYSVEDIPEFIAEDASSTESGGVCSGVGCFGRVSFAAGLAETEAGRGLPDIRRASMTHFLRTILASSVTVVFSTPRDSRARR